MTKLNCYTIKVKKRFFWKKYKAVAHYFKSTIGKNANDVEIPIETWMEVHDVNGSFHYVARIDTRDWMVYPDYSEFISQKEKMAKKKAIKAKSLTSEHLQEMEKHASTLSETSAPELHS